VIFDKLTRTQIQKGLAIIAQHNDTSDQIIDMISWRQIDSEYFVGWDTHLQGVIEGQGHRSQDDKLAKAAFDAGGSAAYIGAGVANIVNGFRSSLYLNVDGSLDEMKSQLLCLADNETGASSAITAYIEGPWLDAATTFSTDVARRIEWALWDAVQRVAETTLSNHGVGSLYIVGQGKSHMDDDALAHSDGSQDAQHEVPIGDASVNVDDVGEPVHDGADNTVGQASSSCSALMPVQSCERMVEVLSLIRARGGPAAKRPRIADGNRDGASAAVATDRPACAADRPASAEGLSCYEAGASAASRRPGGNRDRASAAVTADRPACAADRPACAGSLSCYEAGVSGASRRPGGNRDASASEGRWASRPNASIAGSVFGRMGRRSNKNENSMHSGHLRAPTGQPGAGLERQLVEPGAQAAFSISPACVRAPTDSYGPARCWTGPAVSWIRCPGCPGRRRNGNSAC
jgi:hypothetical protein